MRYFISVSNCYECTKEGWKFVIRETRASGAMAEMVENFKGCTIQSTISNSAHINSDEQVDEINDSEEQVDARNWLRDDSAEQVDQINDSYKQVDAITNDSDKQVDAISDSKKFVVIGSNPSSDPNAATHTTNIKFSQKILISRFVPFGAVHELP